MKYKYYIGDKIAYLFNTEDGVHLKIDLAIDKRLLNKGIDLMKQAYNDNTIVYEEIKDNLPVNQDLLTLSDFQTIINTPNEKNYNNYKNLISIDLYNFIKDIGKQKF